VLFLSFFFFFYNYRTPQKFTLSLFVGSVSVVKEKDIGIVCAENLGVGAKVMLKGRKRAERVRGDYPDIKIMEAPHRHKV
ncbi:hypothetical protein AAY51_23780, partial [Vibrio parahaemolyticus]